MSNSQSNDGQPFPKKPKLDIGRQLYSSSSSSTSNVASNSSGLDMITELCGNQALSKNTPVNLHVNKPKPVDKRNMNDELWGDDLDSEDLKKVDLDESQALSQMAEASNYESRYKHSQVTFQTQSSSNRPQSTNINVSVNTTRNNSRLPLRRIASSGWPSASAHSFSASTTKNICNGTTNDIDSCQNSLERLELENKSLKGQLTEKTGEVNLLRDRLHSVEQDFDKQKKGYSEKVENIKKEAERNYSNLSKEIKSLKGQLEVKIMEMETAERRVQHLSSMNRLSMESPKSRGLIKPTFSPVRGSSRQSQKEDQLMCRHGQMRSKLNTFSLDLLKQLVTPELIKPSQLELPVENPLRISHNPELLSGQPSLRDCQRSTSSKCLSNTSSRCLFYPTVRSMEALTTLLGNTNTTCPSPEPCTLSLLSPRLLDINSENAQQVITQVAESCVRVLADLSQQLDVNSYLPKQYLEKRKDTKHSMTLTQTADLLCHKELYNNERGVCARRALALQSLLVEFSSFAAELILPSLTTEGLKDKPSISSTSSSASVGCHDMLNVINSILVHSKVQKSQRFQGFLAAVITLMKSLLQSETVLSQQSQDLIVQVLHGVVLSRPDSLVLYYTLQCLLAANKYPHITASLCTNSDKCILQGVCMLILYADTLKKHVLSDLFTSWVLALFYGNGLSSPKWLFSKPSETSCQCRPLVSRLCLTLLGEACSAFPKVDAQEKPLLEQLLNRGVLLVSTLLYHDEHFGANVNPASEGHYELFIGSMNTFSAKQEIKLNSASREILESLSIQEGLRKPVYTAVDSEAADQKSDPLLRTLLFDNIQNKELLGYLDK